MAACLISCMTIQTDILGNEENAMPSVVEEGRLRGAMQSVVEEGSAGRVIGSDRFRRDGTKGRLP